MKNKIQNIIFGLAAIVVGCTNPPPPLPTVNGPETAHLVSGTHGYIIYDEAVGGIKAMALPSRKEITIREANKGYDPVHSLSGPDNSGRIVYIENHMGATSSWHALKIASINGGAHETIFTRPGDALWDDVVGDNIALSPVGGHVVFVGKMISEDVCKPDESLELGPLEIWDVDNKTKIDTNIIALNTGLSWFPDGEKLAYAKLVSRNDIPSNDPDASFLQSFGEWSKIPVVYIYDRKSGSDTFFHIGWHPIVSSDGKTVMVYDNNRKPALVDIDSKKVTSIDWHGRWGKVISFTGPNSILYMGLQTTGTAARLTKHNSPLVGPKHMLTIKIADLPTGAFQTVVDYIDSRIEISYGEVD